MKTLTNFIIFLLLFTRFAQANDLQTTSSTEQPVFKIGVPEQIKNRIVIFQKLLESSYKELNIQPEFVVLPTARSYEQLINNELDADLVRFSFDQINQHATKVDAPLYQAKVYAYYYKADFPKNPKLDDLLEKKISIIMGVNITESLIQNAKSKITVKSIDQMIELLQIHRINSALLIVDIPDFDKKIGKIVIYEGPAFHYLAKKNQHLAVKLAHVLQKKLKTKEFSNIQQIVDQAAVYKITK